VETSVGGLTAEFNEVGVKLEDMSGPVVGRFYFTGRWFTIARQSRGTIKVRVQCQDRALFYRGCCFVPAIRMNVREG
jgi:hypothetical protein